MPSLRTFRPTPLRGEPSRISRYLRTPVERALTLGPIYLPSPPKHRRHIRVRSAAAFNSTANYLARGFTLQLRSILADLGTTGHGRGVFDSAAAFVTSFVR